MKRLKSNIRLYGLLMLGAIIFMQYWQLYTVTKNGFEGFGFQTTIIFDMYGEHIFELPFFFITLPFILYALGYAIWNNDVEHRKLDETPSVSVLENPLGEREL